jgi:protein SCO1/2
MPVVVALLVGGRAGDARGGSGTNLTTYLVRGVFKEADPSLRTAVIAHEAIPGYMEAMTMIFDVKSPDEIKTLQPGDEIAFRLFVTDEDDWIEHITKVGHRESKQFSEPAPNSANELGAGDLIPDCLLTNQAGKSIRISNFRGQALALTFFFSRCPLPRYCPRMNKHFSALQQALQKDVVRTNWQLLSISFDPAFDTPEQLSTVAKELQVDPHHWNFATSSMVEIRKIGSAFGLQFRQNNGSLTHNLRTVVVNPAGRVQRVFKGNKWQADELIAEMVKTISSGQNP